MKIPDFLKNKRLRKGTLGSIEQGEFSDIIVIFIFLLGGKGRRQEVISAIQEIFASQLSEPDYKLLQSQKPPKERWIHNVDWAKRKLVQQGLIFEPSKSPHGTWVLTEEGTRAAELLTS